MKNKIRWGIIGTGSIAKKFASSFTQVETGVVVAVAGRTQESASAFAENFSGIQPVSGYEKIICDPEVDALYIATPHTSHARWGILGARAGKQILCEKPLTVNYPEATRLALAAQENGVLLMEAFMVRCHPQTELLCQLMRDKVIGDLQIIRTSFSFSANFNPESRLFKNELAGGGILDVGCYPMAMVRLLAGQAVGKDFENPTHISGVAKLNAVTGVDDYASAVLKFSSGIIAEISTGIQTRRRNELVLVGTQGRIEVQHPWIMTSSDGHGEVRVLVDGKEPKIIPAHSEKNLYALEADAFGKALQQGLTNVPAMPLADSLGNMQALDKWRESAGLVYSFEKPETLGPPTVTDTLRQPPADQLHTVRIPCVNVPVSRLIIGCDNQTHAPSAAAVWDDYFERGGNTFDTAHIYGGGAMERLLGHWIRARGIREKIAVIVKGAHTPDCNPDALIAQFFESLDRLQLDRADIYLMHRDNPEIPAGEFIDVLDELASRGLIGAYGGSNWSSQRVDDANAYAIANGKKPFTVLSNNFSLAEMVQPVWDGCVSSRDANSREWLKKNAITLLAWSSQARGFFIDAQHDDPDGHRNRICDDEQVRCWHSPKNFERRRILARIAKERGVSPVCIAAAYVLHQPFPSCALIGPRAVAETADSFRALGITLSAEEFSALDSV